MRPNRQSPADLVTFTEEILNRKLHFLSSENSNLLGTLIMHLPAVKPFRATGHFLYSLKTPENNRVFNVFWGY